MAATSPLGPAPTTTASRPRTSANGSPATGASAHRRTGAPIIQTVERIADECHTFVHRDHCRRLSTQTTTVSTSASG